MLFSEKFADVVFEVEGERIPAHKNIVAACSEYMNALLSNPQWQENADDRMSVLKLSDLSAVSVRAMLIFIYTGEVDETACMTHTIDVLHLAAQHHFKGSQDGMCSVCHQGALCADRACVSGGSTSPRVG